MTLPLMRALMALGDQGFDADEISRVQRLLSSRLSVDLAALEQAGPIPARKPARTMFYVGDAAAAARRSAIC